MQTWQNPLEQRNMALALCIGRAMSRGPVGNHFWGHNFLHAQCLQQSPRLQAALEHSESSEVQYLSNCLLGLALRAIKFSQLAKGLFSQRACPFQRPLRWAWACSRCLCTSSCSRLQAIIEVHNIVHAWDGASRALRGPGPDWPVICMYCNHPFSSSRQLCLPAMLSQHCDSLISFQEGLPLP